jgi:hypothetical protein
LSEGGKDAVVGSYDFIGSGLEFRANFAAGELGRVSASLELSNLCIYLFNERVGEASALFVSLWESKVVGEVRLIFVSDLIESCVSCEDKVDKGESITVHIESFIFSLVFKVTSSGLPELLEGVGLLNLSGSNSFIKSIKSILEIRDTSGCAESKSSVAEPSLKGEQVIQCSDLIRES